MRLHWLQQRVSRTPAIEQLGIDLAGTRETLLSVGNVSEERQQRIQAYEQQQRVSDGNVQRLEAERDEAVQMVEHNYRVGMDTLKDRLDIVEAERRRSRSKTCLLHSRSQV